MQPVALYMRSSKDRHEVSIDAQRRELADYAKAHGLRVVAEFFDVEVSGSLDEISRPGLRAMLAALRDPDREWNAVLAVDTSRMARDQMVALYVQRECDKAGVALTFAKAPIDGSTAVGEAMLGMLRQFDRLHSRLSADKGVAGMRENLAQGYRAGGKAPLGYVLAHSATGAVRSGEPVRKSRLVLDPAAAPKVGKFLRLRASGEPRAAAARAAGLDLPGATLLGIERNALTYAGFTVWNQRKKHKPTREDPRKTMLWRPRSEWVVSERPVHEALITRAEAERVLAAIDTRSMARRGRKPGVALKPGEFLLSGLLYAPDGVPFHGDGTFYRKADVRTGGERVRGVRIKRDALDALVMEQLKSEVHGEGFVGRVVEEAHRMAEALNDRPDEYAAKLGEVERKIERLTEAVATTGGNPSIYAKLAQYEAQREELRKAQAGAAERARLKAALRAISAADVQAMLEFFPTSAERDVAYMRRTLGALVERITLDPATRAISFAYRLPVGSGKRGNKVASPREVKRQHWRGFPGVLPQTPAPSASGF